MKKFNTVLMLDDLIIKKIDNLIDDQRYEDSLDLIYRIMIALVSNVNFKNIFNHVPQLDSLVQKIGLIIFNSTGLSGNLFYNNFNNINIFLASEIYSTGGHTRLIEDLTKSTSSKNILILTDVFDRYSSGQLSIESLADKINAPIIILPKGSKVSKIINLLHIFSNLNVKSINIIAHHQDVVTYAACNAEIEIPQYYYHHADHNPTLGATIAHFHHYDLFLSSQFLCANSGFIKPLYLPLTSSCRFKKNYAKVEEEKFDILNTATSGTANKFTFDDSEVNYCKIVMNILKNTTGNHFHIGPLSEENISKIEKLLISNNIEKSRFKYLGVVDNIQDAVIINAVNVYITSAPIGGGKAFIDVLGVGIPIFVYRDNNLKYSQEINPVVSDMYNYNSDIIRWSNISELTEKLKTTNFKAYAESLKNFYNSFHSEEKFLNLCEKIFNN